MKSQPPLRETPNATPPPYRPARARRVLVLDDDEATRRIIALFLEHAGYAVDSAEDGERGWEALFAKHYDLLVTDHQMPRLNGLELIRRLRDAGFTLPVIIASGSLDLSEADSYPALALTAILRKPMSFDVLIATAGRCAPLGSRTTDGAMKLSESSCGVLNPSRFLSRKPAQPNASCHPST